MEEVTDETIDVAGHMQKYAAQGALWLPTNLLAHLPDSTDFQTLEDQKVDGRPVGEWQAVASAQQDESAAATSTVHAPTKNPGACPPEMVS